MCFKNTSMLSTGTFSNEELTSHMREFNAVDQEMFHRKRFITADKKWLIFAFE